MTDERKIYPPTSEVPMHPVAPYAMPPAPLNCPAAPYSMGQAPLNRPAAPYPMPQSPPNPMLRVGQVPLGPTPSSVTCPSCGASIVTNVRVEPSTQTHLIALVLCLLCICCTCVPYCVDSCQDANHHCPNCNAYLGTYKR